MNMNRFRTKKKTKETSEGLVRPSTDSDQPPMPTNPKTSKTFKRGKKDKEPEPKLELDLTTALPSTDDFRTSLLMSGLSARFSMLREQDDPKSKIGKASDDSVLFPKRQSRLNDFGFSAHGLSDIAEVSSINGSIRPPFAYSRTDSYYGTDNDTDSITGGSIMNRAKPGEGNVLFGGRQKIYMGNRTLYDNDVSQSAFQKLREREKEQARQAREDNDTQSSRPNSPPLSGYNKNRETSSTTSSGGPSITRSSTAATSFTSQRTPSLSGQHTPITPNVPASGNGGLERSLTKTRRLYENGLDNHLHEQQFSAMNRIDSLTRQRTPGSHTPPAGFSPTFTNLQSERWDRQQVLSKQSMPNLRTTSPPPTGSAMGTFDFGVRLNSIADSKPYGMASPPLSPPMTEYDEQGGLPVQPNDRGKATALGAFSKPTPYDDTKYSQRQLQLQQGRETPPPRKHSPPRAFLPKSQTQPTLRNRADSSATYASDTSRSNSLAQRHFRPQDRIQEDTKAMDDDPGSLDAAAGTFLISADDSSSTLSQLDMALEHKQRGQPKPLEFSGTYRTDQPVKLERPPESQHPAHRQRPFSPEASIPTTQQSPSPAVPTSSTKPHVADPADSPTLGPTTAGLSGMVRQHLRSDSNCSSNYGGDQSTYGSPSRFPKDHSEPNPQHDYSTKTNPWENDDWDHSYYGDANQEGMTPAMTRGSVVPPPLSVRSPNIETGGPDPRKPSWEKELEIHHTRDGSSETQKERMDFKEELASRRRRVQENLKSFVETESRSVSPMPGSEWPKDGLLSKGNTLGVLKPKTSRGSLVGQPKEPAQSKAMKMLGIGNTTISSSPSPGKSSFDDNPWKQEEEEMLRGVTAPTTPPQTRAFRQARRDAQRDRERQVAQRHQQRMGQGGGEPERQEQRGDTANQAHQTMEQRHDRFPPNIRTRQRSPSRERKPPPVAYRNGSQESSSISSNSRPGSRVSRDRSGSDTSGGRSKSQAGKYRDDLAEAMAKGTTASTQGYYEELEVPTQRLMARSPGVSPMLPQNSPMPSPMMAQGSRSRSNSRSTPAGHFDPQKLQHLQGGGENGEIGLPRPSPVAPFVANATPALVQASPAGSGANTPISGAPQSATVFMPPRKKSINKSEISEPKFLHSTSQVTTVNLPPGASLRNGIEHNAPPIPPVNPRRRQTRAMFNGFMGRKDEIESMLSLPAATQSSEEMSTFSADEGDDKPRSRQKLRKSSSEGGNLSARARQATLTSPSPAMPGAFSGEGSPRRPIEGGMF